MTYRTNLVWMVLALAPALGCSSVVSGILEMKGDGGSGDCTTAVDCTDFEPCNGEELCDEGECVPGDPLANGEICDMGGPATGICEGQVCLFPEGCGDGITQTGMGEQCDDGQNGDPFDGCDDECLYSCEDDEECDDDFACNGREVCSIPSPPDMNIRRCQPGSTLPAPMSSCMVPDEIGDRGRCLFPASGDLLCCDFDDGGRPIGCCEVIDEFGSTDCGLPPPPPGP